MQSWILKLHDLYIVQSLSYSSLGMCGASLVASSCVPAQSTPLLITSSGSPASVKTTTGYSKQTAKIHANVQVMQPTILYKWRI